MNNTNSDLSLALTEVSTGGIFPCSLLLLLKVVALLTIFANQFFIKDTKTQSQHIFCIFC